MVDFNKAIETIEGNEATVVLRDVAGSFPYIVSYMENGETKHIAVDDDGDTDDAVSFIQNVQADEPEAQSNGGVITLPDSVRFRVYHRKFGLGTAVEARQDAKRSYGIRLDSGNRPDGSRLLWSLNKNLTPVA